MMRLTIGRAVTFTLLLAVIVGVAWSLMPRPIPVETAEVTKGRFVATVDEDGKTRVRERYVIAAPLAGRLTRVGLKVGDNVKADDVIATIVPSPAPFLDPHSRREAEERLGAAQAAVERTSATVQRARAQADQADKDLVRTRALVERGASTAQALERAKLAMRVADRDMRAAEFQNHAAEQRVNVVIDLLTPHARWAGLGDAYQLDARITVFARDDAIIVPAGALFRRGESWNVFVVDNGRAQTRQVTLLRRSGRSATVASGLSPGEQVIVYPSDRVTSGVRVQPQ